MRTNRKGHHSDFYILFEILCTVNLQLQTSWLMTQLTYKNESAHKTVQLGVIEL